MLESISNHRAFHQSTLAVPHGGQMESLRRKRPGFEPSAEPSGITVLIVPIIPTVHRGAVYTRGEGRGI